MNDAALPADSETGPEARRTNPLGLLVRAAQGLKNAILPMAFIAYGVDEWSYGLPLAIAIGLLIGATTLLGGWLEWLRTTYTVSDTDIRVDSGVLARAARSVPYERIQDVSLEQSFLPRLFGLVEVRFETGAGGKDELKLAYLSEEEGERLRETVRELREGDAPSLAPGTEAEEESPPLFAVDNRRLLTFGLFEFSLVVVAVVAGAVQQFDFLLPFDPWDTDEWEEQFAGPSVWLAGMGPLVQAAGALLALASLALIGFATGIVRTVLRDYGFRLDRTPKGFRRRRGLLTRTDVVMPVHRVQALKIGTGILRRRFGWHSLKFVSLAQDAGSASHVVAPFAQERELVPIVQAARFHPPADDLAWRRGSKSYHLASGIFEVALMLLVTIAILFAPRPELAILPFAAAAFLALRRHFLWRFDRHAMDARQIWSRRGWLAPHTDIASRIKLQSVEIAQGPLGRRLSYATLHLGLAGGSFAIRGLPAQRARDLRGAILASIGSTDFSDLLETET